MIFVLHGKDSFRKQLRLEELKAKYLEPGMESLCFQTLNEPSLVDFIAAVKTPGFGFGSKIILIKNFKYLENKAEDKEIEEILNTLETIPESVVLIFDSDKVTGTIKLVKNLKSKFQSELEFDELTPFTPWDTKAPASWLCKNFSGLEMSCAEFFVEQIGAEDSGRLYTEMRRLSTLNESVSKELIEKECGSKTDIFKFVRLLAMADLDKANQELDRIILAKEAHLGLLAMMETSISRYLKLKLAQAERRSKEEKVQLLGISPGRLYYQEQEVQKMQVSYLEELLGKTLSAERSVKRGRMEISKALKYLVNS